MCVRQMATSLKDIEISHISRYILAVSFIEEGDKVLDACCGTGYGIKLMSELSHAALIEGFDISKEAFDIARVHFTPNVSCCSFDNFQSGESYDIITCFEAIEHVDEPKRLVQMLASKLKPGGTLIFSSPNQTMMPWSADRFPEHKKHFTFDELSGILSENGLKVVHTFSQQSKFISCINSGRIGKFMILVCS